MISDIVFDFFGTLVDYRLAKFIDPHERVAYEYLLEQGCRLDFDAYVQGFGEIFHRFDIEARRTRREPHLNEIGRAFLRTAVDPKAIEKVLVPFLDRFIDQWNSSTRAIDGLDQLLSNLSTQYRLSIISNTFYPPLVQDNLVRMGLTRHFTQVVLSAELGWRKPDPTIFRHALERLGIAAGQAIYVGDDVLADFGGATGAGLQAVLIDPQRMHPELGVARIDRIHDLPRTVDELTRRGDRSRPEEREDGHTLSATTGSR